MLPGFRDSAELGLASVGASFLLLLTVERDGTVFARPFFWHNYRSAFSKLPVPIGQPPTTPFQRGVSCPVPAAAEHLIQPWTNGWNDLPRASALTKDSSATISREVSPTQKC